jgi:hypothetical protein
MAIARLVAESGVTLPSSAAYRIAYVVNTPSACAF